jgi:serine/threonine protein kinase
MGTARYMSPEIFACYVTHTSCHGRYALSVDVYAFGIVFWELLQCFNEQRSGLTSEQSVNAPLLRSKSCPSGVNDVFASGNLSKMNMNSLTMTYSTSIENQNRDAFSIRSQSLKYLSNEENSTSSWSDVSYASVHGMGAEVANLQNLRQSKFGQRIMNNRNSEHCNDGIKVSRQQQPLSREELGVIWTTPSLARLDPSTPSRVPALIKKCWNMNPQQRPSFECIIKELEAVKLDWYPSPNDKHYEPAMEPLAQLQVELRPHEQVHSTTTLQSLTDSSKDDIINTSRVSHDQKVDYCTKLSQHEKKNQSISFERRQRSRLRCWGRTWNKCGLHFADHRIENRFILKRLHGEEYHGPTKYALVMLAIFNLSYACAMLKAVIESSQSIGITIMFATVIALLKVATYATAAAAGWIRKMRPYINKVVRF